MNPLKPAKKAQTSLKYTEYKLEEDEEEEEQDPSEQTDNNKLNLNKQIGNDHFLIENFDTNGGDIGNSPESSRHLEG